MRAAGGPVPFVVRGRVPGRAVPDGGHRGSPVRSGCDHQAETGTITETSAADLLREMLGFAAQRRIPRQGDRPVLRLDGDLAHFLPWLAIGETTHVGSHAALGMGGYRLLVEG